MQMAHPHFALHLRVADALATASCSAGQEAQKPEGGSPNGGSSDQGGSETGLEKYVFGASPTPLSEDEFQRRAIEWKNHDGPASYDCETGLQEAFFTDGNVQPTRPLLGLQCNGA